MIIPNYSGGPITDKNGYPTPEFKSWHDQIILTLQQNAGTEGLVPASLPSTDISTIQAGTTKQNGTLIYDQTTDELKANIGGTFKVVQVV